MFKSPTQQLHLLVLYSPVTVTHPLIPIVRLRTVGCTGVSGRGALAQDAKELQHVFLVHWRRVANAIPEEALQLRPVAVDSLCIGC